MRRSFCSLFILLSTFYFPLYFYPLPTVISFLFLLPLFLTLFLKTASVYSLFFVFVFFFFLSSFFFLLSTFHFPLSTFYFPLYFYPLPTVISFLFLLPLFLTLFLKTASVYSLFFVFVFFFLLYSLSLFFSFFFLLSTFHFPLSTFYFFIVARRPFSSFLNIFFIFPMCIIRPTIARAALSSNITWSIP